MAKIGVGVIGCGDIARVRYFPSIEALPELELKAVYSRTGATCEPIVARYGGKLYGDLDSLLADTEVDAIIVATPHPSHAALSILALEAGKHVLTEKPMATSLADANRVREAAKLSGRVFMALPFDELPPMDEARRLIRSGEIGRVSSADGVLAHQGPVHAPWFFDREQAGWGVLADLGIYLISQFTYLFGPAESVSGRVTTVFPNRSSEDGETFKATVDDNVAAVIVWPDNILGTIRASWCCAADKQNFIWKLKIYGTSGIIFVDMASPERPLVVYAPKHRIEGADRIVHNGMTDCYLPPLPAWDHHKDILRSFANAIRDGTILERDSSAMRQHHVIEIIAKLYESSETGRTMGLETKY